MSRGSAIPHKALFYAILTKNILHIFCTIVSINLLRILLSLIHINKCFNLGKKDKLSTFIHIVHKSMFINSLSILCIFRLSIRTVVLWNSTKKFHNLPGYRKLKIAIWNRIFYRENKSSSEAGLKAEKASVSQQELMARWQVIKKQKRLRKEAWVSSLM